MKDKKPNVYKAYENEIDGEYIGYFWNKFDAFIACMQQYKRNITHARKQYRKNKHKPNYPPNYLRVDKNIVLMYIKRLRKYTIREIDIK